jgi:hypothetical protein
MIFKSGRYEGKSYAWVLLRHADYAGWLLARDPDSFAAGELARLRDRFDAKPFVRTCRRCRGEATRASAYRGETWLEFWCEDCNMHSAGAIPGRLTEVRTFDDALAHLRWTGNRSRADRAEIVKRLAAAKGCPERLTQAGAEGWLG